MKSKRLESARNTITNLDYKSKKGEGEYNFSVINQRKLSIIEFVLYAFPM